MCVCLCVYMCVCECMCDVRSGILCVCACVMCTCFVHGSENVLEREECVHHLESI